MSHIVEKKAENYEKQFTVKFRQILRNYRNLKMLRLFVRSVYIALGNCASSIGHLETAKGILRILFIEIAF